jgi:hypothetical protein
VRTSELGIVIVMMIVRTPPNASGAQSKDAEDPHENVGQARIRQDRLVLLVVINDEQS